ncbi:fibronectin type III domain-containing protein, partial [Spirochaetota bacterium]
MTIRKENKLQYQRKHLHEGKGIIRKAFLFIFIIYMCSAALFGSIIMSPYLQAMTKNYIYVLVECNSTTTVTVEYGTTTSYGMSATTESYETTSAGTRIHNVRLTGLNPNTRYHYRARQGSGSWTQDYSFNTLVNEGTPFRFAVMADFYGMVSVHDKAANYIKSSGSLFYLNGGDISTTPGTYPNYDSVKQIFFRDACKNLIAEVPFYLAVGNHEGWNADTRAMVQAPDSASGHQAYYSFDSGDLHVLVLASETSVGYDVGSAQYNFAKNDLASTTKRWKIAIFHKPAYCKGTVHNPDGRMQRFAKDIFEPYGLHMALSGDSHYYQRNVVNGVNHFVLASVGSTLYDPIGDWYTVKQRRGYHFGIFDVSPTQLKMTVRDENYNVVDIVILNQEPAGTPTSTPSGPTSTPTPVSGGITINNIWTASGAPYTVGSSFSTGINYYTDRTYVFNSIPASVSGLQFIKTANGDKTYAADPFLTFDINKNAIVYVGYAKNAGSIPSWLSGWTDEGDLFVSSCGDNYGLRLYSKTFNAGRVSLGGNRAGGGDGYPMYSVMVKDNG